MPPDSTSMSTSDDDPLTVAMQPPPDETLEERQAREKNEVAATLRSESIDQYLKPSISGKQHNVIKLLVLGLPVFPHRMIINS